MSENLLMLLQQSLDMLEEQALHIESPMLSAGEELLARIRSALSQPAELARASLPVGVPDGWALVPVEPTPEMVSAAEEAHMPFGDMDIALRMAILSAPAAPAAEQSAPGGVEDGVDFGFDDRSVRVSQEAYSIFLDREQVLRDDIAALEAENERLRNTLLEVTTRHFAENWGRRASDNELEQYLSAGIAQLEGERDQFRAELERVTAELEQYKRDAERMRDLLCRARAFVDQWDDDSQEFMDLCGDIDNAISQQAECGRKEPECVTAEVRIGELESALSVALTSMLDGGYSNDAVVIKLMRAALNKQAEVKP